MYVEQNFELLATSSERNKKSERTCPKLTTCSNEQPTNIAENKILV